MAHSLDNPASITALKNKLLRVLRNAKMVVGVPMIWGADFDSFKSEAAKATSKWLHDYDLDQIVLAVLFALHNESSVDEALADVLGDDLIDEVVTRVLGEISSPNSYWFYFPLPQIVISEDIELSDNVQLLAPNVESRPTLLEGLLGGLSISGSVLRVKGTGFVYTERNQSAFVDALKHLKWTLAIASLFHFFIRTPKTQGALSFASMVQQADFFRIGYVAERLTPYPSSKITLGLGLSRFLDEIKFQDGKWTADKKQTLISYVGDNLKILTDPLAYGNVKSLRRALEWYFDAGIDEDEHMRFIKICIGLEAAISEHTEDMGITEQLADRCAFLLEKTSVARQEIRELMRKIYKLRSKLVHGVEVGFSQNDRELAGRAEEILRTVLRIELKAVVNWRKAVE